MNKKLCDMCGKDAPLNGQDTGTYNKDKLIIDEQLLCDEKAKIRVFLNTSFVKHSGGFGGPPDLCPDCFIKCTRLLGEKIFRYAETLKDLDT